MSLLEHVEHRAFENLDDDLLDSVYFVNYCLDKWKRENSFSDRDKRDFYLNLMTIYKVCLGDGKEVNKANKKLKKSFDEAVNYSARIE